MTRVEQPWQIAMQSLIAKLKKTDRFFTCGEWDRLGMLNFSEKVSHPEWKNVIETQEAQKELQIIKESLAEAAAA